ncbi:MAG: phosphatase PAP2 family protein [Cyanobacteria bacterium J06555_13]
MPSKNTPKNIYKITGYSSILIVLVGLSSAVLLEHTFAFDPTVLNAVNQLHSPPLDRMMLFFTWLGNPQWTVPLALAVFASLWFRTHQRQATIFALDCFGGAVLSTCLKIFFGKIRPALWESPIVETTFSYPSGHALGAVVLYGFLAYLLAIRLPGYRGIIYIGAIALCLAIGFSRLYLGVHWPTDLIGGYIIGFLWTSLCINLLEAKRKHVL